MLKGNIVFNILSPMIYIDIYALPTEHSYLALHY